MPGWPSVSRGRIRNLKIRVDESMIEMQVIEVIRDIGSVRVTEVQATLEIVLVIAANLVNVKGATPATATARTAATERKRIFLTLKPLG